MKTKRLSLDDFKKKAATSTDKLSYAKGGLAAVSNFICTGGKGGGGQDQCHPAAN
ncbi:MAG: hypothetical protein WBA74_03405 [Cyclobacteriaceae bacterium]